MSKIWVKIGSLSFFLASFILFLGNIYRTISTSTPDFTILWISAKDLVAANNPYLDPKLFTPNAYPPVSEIPYLPLALLPYQISQAIFVFILFLSIVGAVFLSIKLTTGKVAWPHFLFFMGSAFLSFPTKFSLGMGQVNPLVLFLLLLAYFLESKNKSVWSGITFGVSIILKPIFVFFVLFFALKKSWKVVSISLVTVFLSIIVTLIFWDPGIWLSWIKTGILPLTNLTGREAYSNQGLMGFISRFSANINIRKYLTGFISFLLVTEVSIFALTKKDRNLVLSLFIITLLFIDSASWQHHFVWLIFPFIVLINQIINSKNVLFLVLAIFAYLLASWNFKNPFPFPPIVLSNQFYGCLILWLMNTYCLISPQNKTTKIDKGSKRYKFFESLNFW